MNVKKLAMNGLFLVVLIIGTLYFVLKDQEIDLLFECIESAKKSWLFIGLILVILFITLESVIINYLMKSLSYKVKLSQCVKYSFIGFFVSAITPSATGGQPAQMFYMKKDGISIAVSSLVMLVVTVAYKLVLLILGGVMLLLNFDTAMTHIKGIEIILIFGIAVNVVIVGVMLLLIFKQSLAKKLAGNFILFLGKHKIIKNHSRIVKNLLYAITKYDKGAEYLKSHKRVLFNTLVITFIQRLSLFSITYIVYKAFGLSGTSAMEIITLQIIISLAVDNLPLPGGMGASEGIFMMFFEYIFTPQFLTAGLLLSRGLNYYSIIILGGIVLIYAQLQSRKKI